MTALMISMTYPLSLGGLEPVEKSDHHCGDREERHGNDHDHNIHSRTFHGGAPRRQNTHVWRW